MKYTVSTYIAQKYLAYLRKAFNEAIKDGYLTDNPCLEIENFKILEKQPLYFNENRFHKLLSLIEDEDLKDLIIFDVHSAMPQMEILTLKWYQIIFKERLIIIDNKLNITKSKMLESN